MVGSVSGGRDGGWSQTSGGGSSLASISGCSMRMQVSVEMGVVGSAQGVTTSRGDGGGEAIVGGGGALLARISLSLLSDDRCTISTVSLLASSSLLFLKIFCM